MYQKTEILFSFFRIFFYIARKFNKCQFRTLTGLECPGCGSQRAIHALLHLDVAAAFRYNALLVASLPLIGILGYAEWYRTRKPEFYRKMHRPLLMWGYFAVTVIWWIGRNLG